MLTNKSQFDYQQYQADALASKSVPLSRELLPGVEHVGIKIECFALPGLEHDPKRYVLSQTGVAGAVKRNRLSLFQFLQSKRFKRLCGNGLSLFQFSVLGSELSIIGVPGFVAVEYWHEQDKKGNQEADSIIRVLLETKLDDLVSDAHGITHTAQERANNFKTTWEILRGKTRNSYRQIKRLVESHYSREYFRLVPHHHQANVEVCSYVKWRSNAFLKDMCCDMVQLFTRKRPYDIFQELQLEGDDPDREELRDWYSIELLDGIEIVQEKILEEFHHDPDLIDTRDIFLLIADIITLQSDYETGTLDWHKPDWKI